MEIFVVYHRQTHQNITLVLTSSQKQLKTEENMKRINKREHHDATPMYNEHHKQFRSYHHHHFQINTKELEKIGFQAWSNLQHSG